MKRNISCSPLNAGSKVEKGGNMIKEKIFTNLNEEFKNKKILIKMNIVNYYKQPVHIKIVSYDQKRFVRF